MRHLDLFSGIGGFALAARWVGWETIGFCETDNFCRDVIEKNFGSVRWVSVPGSVGGGQALGLDGDEKLSGLKPDWLVIENVYHTWRQWVPELRRKLHERGYSSLPIRVSAADLGASHIRARCFIVANADSHALRELGWWWCWQGRQKASELAESWDFRPSNLGTNDGISSELDKARRQALGNAIVPQCAQLIFEAINEMHSL